MTDDLHVLQQRTQVRTTETEVGREVLQKIIYGRTE